jgi:hypothetical protein
MTCQEMQDEAMETGACSVEIAKYTWVTVTDEGTWLLQSPNGEEKLAWNEAGELMQDTWLKARGVE